MRFFCRLITRPPALHCNQALPNLRHRSTPLQRSTNHLQPAHSIKNAEPRPGKRSGNQVIWSVGLPTTESTKYKISIPDGNRSTFEGLELWIEGMDSTNIIGAEAWTGVADPGISEAIEAQKQGLS